MSGFDSIAKRQVKLAIQCPSKRLSSSFVTRGIKRIFPRFSFRSDNSVKMFFGIAIAKKTNKQKNKEMLIIMFCGGPVAAPAGQMKW